MLTCWNRYINSVQLLSTWLHSLRSTFYCALMKMLARRIMETLRLVDKSFCLSEKPHLKWDSEFMRNKISSMPTSCRLCAIWNWNWNISTIVSSPKDIRKKIIPKRFSRLFATLSSELSSDIFIEAWNLLLKFFQILLACLFIDANKQQSQPTLIL